MALHCNYRNTFMLFLQTLSTCGLFSKSAGLLNLKQHFTHFGPNTVQALLAVLIQKEGHHVLFSPLLSPPPRDPAHSGSL